MFFGAKEMGAREREFLFAELPHEVLKGEKESLVWILECVSPSESSS